MKNELTAQIDQQLNAFDKMVDEEVAAFNKAFNDLNLNYLFVEE